MIDVDVVGVTEGVTEGVIDGVTDGVWVIVGVIDGVGVGVTAPNKPYVLADIAPRFPITGDID